MSLVLFEEVSPHLGKITLNDPENLNAMGEDMAREFRALVGQLKSKTSLRAIILTGAGRAFSAGGNLKMLLDKSKLGGEENRLKMLDFYNSFLSILDIGVPLIAAINGHAIGAGLCVASACDIRIVADGAKLGFTFVKLGLHPGMGATYFLPRVLGYAKAAELQLTGRVIDAQEALRLGLVSQIVPVDQVLGAAEKVAEEILSSGPQSVRMLLESLRQGAGDLTSALAREAQCQSVNYASLEFKEGVTATMEKRKPTF